MTTWPQHDPETPDTAEAEKQAKQDYIRAWYEDELAPEAHMEPLQALIEQESGLFQQAVKDYIEGDQAEFEQSSARIIRELIRRIES